MEDIEYDDCSDNENTLKGDEEFLVGHELAVPTLAELSNTEDGTPQDAEGGDSKGNEEALEEQGRAHADKGRVLGEDGGSVGAVGAVNANGEVC